MAYKQIHEGLWSDPDLKKLPVEVRHFFIYTITNPHSHFSGIYYLPKVMIMHEMGFTEKTCDRCIEILSAGITHEDRLPVFHLPHIPTNDTGDLTPEDRGIDRGIDTPLNRVFAVENTLHLSGKKLFLAYDTEREIVWVKNMLRYQVPKGSLNSKQAKGVANHLAHLHGTYLIGLFMEYYEGMKIPFFMPERYPYRNTTVKATETATAAVSATAEYAESEKIAFDFSTGKFSRLTEERISYYKGQFPAIDVQMEILKAEAWAKANPKNKKSNWEKFLVSWLTRAQDKAPARRSYAGGAGEHTEGYVKGKIDYDLY